MAKDVAADEQERVNFHPPTKDEFVAFFEKMQEHRERAQVHKDAEAADKASFKEAHGVSASTLNQGFKLWSLDKEKLRAKMAEQQHMIKVCQFDLFDDVPANDDAKEKTAV